MTLRIVDNKRVDMTDDEFTLYNKIVKSYTVNNNRGEDLFKGLFHTNKEGLILFLIPPSTKQTSMEIWMFLMCLQQQQQLRKMRQIIDDELKQVRKKISEFK